MDNHGGIPKITVINIRIRHSLPLERAGVRPPNGNQNFAKKPHLSMAEGQGEAFELYIPFFCHAIARIVSFKFLPLTSTITKINIKINVVKVLC